MKHNNGSMPSILDREVSSVSLDAFGHAHFADALRDMVESPLNEPPFSVGLLGKWGTGKSSVKEMYLADLRNDRSRDRNRHTREDRFHVTTFNAWRFGGDNIKRALLRHVFLNLEGDEKALKDALFGQSERTAPQRRQWKDILQDALHQWGWGLVQVFFIFAVAVSSLFVIREIFDIANEWPAALITLAVFSATGLVLRYMLDPKRLQVPLFANITHVDLPHTTAEQYEDLLIEQMKLYKAGKTTSGRGKKCQRIIIFVDDLDRLSAEEMIEGLDAIRTFMEIPNGQASERPGIVFVVSADETRVADALARRRRPDTPGAIFNQVDARRYLDRIFQFRLEIPPFPKRDMRDYALQKLNEEARAVVDVLTEDGVSLETLVDRMIHVDVQSPRNALQILNAFLQSWWIARRREAEGPGSEIHGGLHEGAVTNHPLSLAALSVIRVDFPNFYSDLQQDPQLIQRFTDVFIRRRPIDGLPESGQAILGSYGDLEKHKVNPEHAALRRFLTSLQGHRWPPSLQPLLLLSEDPLTRRLGDGYVNLNNAFVSGDTQGVLAEMGRHLDTNPLSPVQVRQLRDLQEELHNETQSRQHNAYRVIADLAKRIPDEHAPMLMDPLAREVAGAEELRWQVGVGGLKQVLVHAEQESRRRAAASLIQDLLKTEGAVNWRLETGEAPSLDEAISFAREACSIALWVREQSGLDTAHDNALLGWLLTRQVASEGGSHLLPFAELDKWIREHETSLLPALGERYTAMVADEIHTGELEGIERDGLMRRCQSVFEQLWNAGEDSRQVLWQQLSRFVSLKLPEAVSLAWQTMKAHSAAPDSENITAFVARFAERLNKDMENEEEWRLDWRTAGAALLEIVESRHTDIGDEAGEALAELGKSWSGIDDTALFSVRLVGLLLPSHRDQAIEVIDDWISRVLDDLPAASIDWLAANFVARLSESQRTTLTSSIQPLYDREDITEEESTRYVRLIRNMPRDVRESSEIQGHIRQLFANIPGRYNSPDYLHRVFPAAIELIGYAEPAIAGRMLHDLLTNAASVPATYAWLHSEMAQYWLPPSEELAPYNPQEIFDQARSLVTDSPRTDWAPLLLKSMANMIDQGVVDDENATSAVDVAIQIWPHHSETALEIFTAFRQSSTPDKVADLQDGVSAEDRQTIDRLLQAWTHFAHIMALEEKLNATKRLLTKNAVSTENEGDLYLRLWTNSQEDDQTRLFSSLLEDENLTDAQMLRVWLQAERLSQRLGSEFFVNVLPTVLDRADLNQTANAVFAAAESVSTLFTTAAQRYTLSESLIRGFLGSTSLETKNRIASWLHDIQTTAVLDKLEEYGEPTEDDIELLKERFPGHVRSLNKILERIRESAGDE